MRPTALLLACCASTGCSLFGPLPYPGRPPADDEERLEHFLEEVHLAHLDRTPALAAREGVAAVEAGWEDHSATRAAIDRALVERELWRARSEFDRRALPAAAALSLRLFELDAERDLARHRWREHRYRVRPGDGEHLRVPRELARAPVEDQEGLARYLGRLRGAVALVDGLEAELRPRFEEGFRAPRFAYRRAGAECRALLELDPTGERPALLDDLARKLTRSRLTRLERARGMERAREVVSESLGPAFLRLADTLEALGRERGGDDGVWSLPEGEAFYAHALQDATTLPLSPEELHRTAMTEVSRLHAAMRVLLRQLDHPGGLPSFFRFLRADPELYEPNDAAGRETLLARAREVVAGIAPRVGELVREPPPVELELFVRAPPASETVGRTAAGRDPGLPDYEPGTPSRPARWALDLSDTRALPRYLLPARVYRGGWPGAHLRRALCDGHDEWPRFRHTLELPVWSRGWDLYALSLPRELGLVDDPYADFGLLAEELWEACRAVIDTGVHHERWTRERAVEWLTANAPHPEASCAAEVDHVLVHPGEAAAALVGAMRLRTLREDAEVRLGRDFDVRRFHAAVLGAGPVPVSILAERVERWVQER